jgi:chemotaxis signal transduction protein
VRSYVRLTVASEAYAVPVEHVLEAAELGRVRAVPGARRELLGVSNLRGRILPVIDLAAVLGVHAGAGRVAPPRRLLVTEAGGFQAGFAVDEVSDIGSLGEPTEPTPESGPGLLLGAALSEGELIGVVDVPGVFDLLLGARQ